MIDSTIVPPHYRCWERKNGDNQTIGRSSGGLSTKIHATCDALGNPTGFYLTKGQENDLKGSDALTDNLLKAKQYRAIATRYDKTSINFLEAIHLVSIVV